MMLVSHSDSHRLPQLTQNGGLEHNPRHELKISLRGIYITERGLKIDHPDPNIDFELQTS